MRLIDPWHSEPLIVRVDNLNPNSVWVNEDTSYFQAVCLPWYARPFECPISLDGRPIGPETVEEGEEEYAEEGEEEIVGESEQQQIYVSHIEIEGRGGRMDICPRPDVGKGPSR